MQQSGESDQYNTNGDLRLVKHAIRDRWPVPQETRVEVITHITKVLSDPEKDDNLKNNVARTLVAIDGLNLKQEELRIREKPKHVIHTNMSMDELEGRISELQEELGISSPAAALEAMNSQKPSLPAPKGAPTLD